MPYIHPNDRYEQVRKHLEICREDIGVALGKPSRNAGDFNYMISVGIVEYLKEKGLNYANCNEIVGMLECCKREFQRRVVDIYEEEKQLDNGDCGYEDLMDSGVIGKAEFTKEDYER